MNHRPQDQMRTRLKVGMMVLLAVLAAGTVGYLVIEGWPWMDCLYMTVITISTVGYQEVAPLSPGGKLFTIAVILSGIGAAAFVGSSLIELVLERHAGQSASRRKMKKTIESLTGHIIVCGYGRMGRYVVNALAPYRADCVIVERDPEVCEALAEEGRLVVAGDATDDAVLAAAGIERAEALVATLDTDADNLYLTLTAHGVRPELKIIVRAEEAPSHAKLLRAGATRVVSPYEIGASHIAQLVAKPRILDFIELVTHQGQMELDVEQIEVRDDSPFANQSLASSRLRQSLGRMIVAIKRKDGSTVFDPPPDTVLHPGDTLVSVGGKPAN